MGVSSSESHDLTAFYELLMASFGVLSQNTGFYPSLDRIVETMLGPLNLGPGGGSYNEPISHLQRPDWWTIEGEKTIFWSITKLGRSVRRMIREGSLALFRTSYKELSQRGINPSLGVHHLFLKRDKFHSESASFTLAITCLLHISPSS